MNRLNPPATHLLNRCAKYLARDLSQAPRHSYGGHLSENPEAARFLEGWRFPAIDCHREPNDPLGTQRWNAVSFIWRAPDLQNPPATVELIGDFNPSSQPLAMGRVEDSRYWSITLRMPVGEVFRYLFRIDGSIQLDPINPRRKVSPDKSVWSFFHTDYCQVAVTFERWEISLLTRITNHILPFNTREARIYLSKLDPRGLGGSRGNLFRFDQAVGAVNFIDKLVAGPELHYRDDYKTCLSQMNRILRTRNPFLEPDRMEETLYTRLYEDLASGNIQEWDRSTYNDPSSFLKTMRRHVFMGAFSHPKYGGNPGGFAWDFLSERFPPFDWRQGLETPLGTNTEYLG